MSDALEAELDRLFQLPPAAMVEARTALADRLRKAGDRAAAAHVKRVKRATPTAWALNQVHFGQPELLAHARAQTAALRALHARDDVDRLQLAAAVAAQRDAVRAVIDAALQHGQSAGIATGPALQRKLLLSLQAWLAGASDEQPGRMTEDIEPSGFGALAEVGVTAPAVAVLPAPPPIAAAEPEPAPTAAAEPKPRGPDPQALARATEQLNEQEQRARGAREQLTRRNAERERAQAELARAAARVQESEQTLARVRSQRDACDAELTRARTASEEAERARQRADEAVEAARAELARLRSA